MLQRRIMKRDRLTVAYEEPTRKVSFDCYSCLFKGNLKVVNDKRRSRTIYIIRKRINLKYVSWREYRWIIIDGESIFFDASGRKYRKITI